LNNDTRALGPKDTTAEASAFSDVEGTHGHRALDVVVVEYRRGRRFGNRRGGVEGLHVCALY
jgi:hypothetical protein